jgi:hypothetical protein
VIKSEPKSKGKEEAAICHNTLKGLREESKYFATDLDGFERRVRSGFQASRNMHCTNRKATLIPFLRNS